MIRGLLVWAFATTLALAGPSRAQRRETRMQGLLDRFRADYGLAGATAAIVLRDGRVPTVATGPAEGEAGPPMTPDTPMLAARIGNPSSR